MEPTPDEINEIRILFAKGDLANLERRARHLITKYPDAGFAWKALGLSLRGRPEEALAAHQKSVEFAPEDASAHNNLGSALRLLGRRDEALGCFDRAIALMPEHAEAHYNRGVIQQEKGQIDSAISSFSKSIEIKPSFADAYVGLGMCLVHNDQLQDAAANYYQALEINPDLAEAHHNLGVLLKKLGKTDEALSSYQRALELRPNNADTLCNIGNAHKQRGQYSFAEICYQRALAINPSITDAKVGLIDTRLKTCAWDRLEQNIAEAIEQIIKNNASATPFTLLACSDSPSKHQAIAQIYCQTNHPEKKTLPEIVKHPKKERIHIGYFSADFHNHATTYLIAELLERHDKSRFELTAFSFGENWDDEMRRRVSASFDHFVNALDMSDLEVATVSRKMGIDIAVDLKGYTQDARPGIFALRAAPIQINYLGFPGTMGADYIDYLIADPILIPESHQQYYTEKIVYLPDTYQPNDRMRIIADRQFTRKELGLPEQGFVFCCFNNNYKIMPDTFDSWMHILSQVEGSVLWLFEDNTTASDNLRLEAQIRGIEQERLVFAQKLPLPEHLARHRCADLFLDTHPYNAHTTASDALWAGLPVLTRLGETFAGRVAASLLNAIQLPELVAQTRSEYETLAIELAKNPEKLEYIRQKLEKNRLITPLFDSQLFAHHLETAYSAIYDRYQQDLPPDTIAI